MFTGIVQAVAPLAEVIETAYGRQFCIDLPASFRDVAIGASVNVDGVCLTCTGVAEKGLMFDVVKQTLRVTNLAERLPGERVNCERSLRFGGEVGGHIVSGHVLGTGVLLSISDDEDDGVRMRIELAPAWMRYVFDKGFIAIDGASLTVAAVDLDAGWFEIALIPETLRATAFLDYVPGQALNIEVESQTKILVDVLERMRRD
jgi:riboflavin synthase